MYACRDGWMDGGMDGWMDGNVGNENQGLNVLSGSSRRDRWRNR
jgi:hypothetical protein